MSRPDQLQTLEAAIGSMERALDRPDPESLAAASALLGASLSPLRMGDLGRATEQTDRFTAALARVEGLRTRIAVLADFDRGRLAIAGEARRRPAESLTYGRRGRLQLAGAMGAR